MHEMAIAVELIEQAVEAAKHHHVTRIDQIDITVGEMRRVIPDAMQCAFRAASQGTIAEGATLKITQEPIAAVCRECDHRYQPDAFDFSCPQCGAADARIVSGNDIVLQSLVCDAPVVGEAV